MNDRIYMSSPDIGEAEKSAVRAAMDSGWIAPLGPEVDGFEQDLAARVGVAHGVALSSGTAALHLGLLGLGIGPGDIVVTSSMTFAATANAIVYTGATPVFVDSDSETGNIDVGLLAEALSTLASEGTPAKAIVPVDLLGKAVDYTSVELLARRYGIPVLADAAESLGATHAGRAAGSFGAASIVSFNGNKIMTTSGGGMLLTDDEALAQRTRYLATQARQPVAHYEHTDIGYNYRLSNLLAALGRAQLARLDEMIARRRELRAVYTQFFATVDGVRIFGRDGAEDNCWLTSIVVDREESGFTPSELQIFLANRDIESRPLWKPMHLQPVFAGARTFLNGNSEQLFSNGLTLPSGSALSPTQLRRVMDSLTLFVEARR
ncbi:dTDP-4-amino-4,6-dideoxygalactose transaminase [Agrococcus baldri]|uniref:dTDP-4-amino-4,6-dideoxygalactose transaminase n=1 Tax=Agrococcus baldri TaxID=153730 RepID=A0AA94HKG3_9MICO|nr:aminotransferase class I/II-fold pyridoxal phosphate-dependent enzyme [Agrococcus baldri]SFS00243.1 dTDP-4-amino-4,6-dideoxygalactose transaminase [Agrococcus baldri]